MYFEYDRPDFEYGHNIKVPNLNMLLNLLLNSAIGLDRSPSLQPRLALFALAGTPAQPPYPPLALLALGFIECYTEG